VTSPKSQDFTYFGICCCLQVCVLLLPILRLHFWVLIIMFTDILALLPFPQEKPSLYGTLTRGVATIYGPTYVLCAYHQIFGKKIYWRKAFLFAFVERLFWQAVRVLAAVAVVETCREIKISANVWTVHRDQKMSF